MYAFVVGARYFVIRSLKFSSPFYRKLFLCFLEEKSISFKEKKIIAFYFHPYQRRIFPLAEPPTHASSNRNLYADSAILQLDSPSFPASWKNNFRFCYYTHSFCSFLANCFQFFIVFPLTAYGGADKIDIYFYMCNCT